MILRLWEPKAASRGEGKDLLKHANEAKVTVTLCLYPLPFHWANPSIKFINNGYKYQVCFHNLGFLPLLGTSSWLPLLLLLFLCIIGNNTEEIEECWPA